MLHAITELLGNALMITGFVFIMMLIIEYLNVFSRGNWDRIIGHWRWGQSILTSALGASPGCLGAYAVASLYMHRVISVGAMAAAMVATCGDEAFVMLAMFPTQAGILFGVLFGVGIATGILTDLVMKAHRTDSGQDIEHYQPSHGTASECVAFSAAALARQWRNCSSQRGWLSLFLILFILGILSGTIQHQHVSIPHSQSESIEDVHEAHAHAEESVHPDHEDCVEAAEAGAHADHTGWDWLKVTFLALSLIALFIVITVPDHFLDEHLWNHIAKVHAWRIFLWTVGALLLTHALVHLLDVRALVENHALPLLLIACLVGLLPESGPHLVFVALYADGAIPFSVLLASSVVQDGHGMLPVLSHSRRAFVGVKLLKLAIGLSVGLLGHFMGW